MKKIVSGTVFVLMTMPLSVLAQNKLQNPINVPSIEAFVEKILDIIVLIGVPIVAFFLIYSGFLFVTARGNPDKLTDAKQTFLYTIIGAALILGAWVLAQIIGGTIDALR